jgi:glycosyltransferase involved in cell wall biosynthesis
MSADRPLISILLLCRNEAVFIRRAVRSILSQNLDRPVEIILLDDASVDGSAAIVQAEVAAAARPGYTLRVITSDKNLGNGAAFVTALHAARGQFYHVLDGDDYWIDPDKLRKQVALLEDAPNLAGVAHRAIVRASSDGTESFHPQQEPLKLVLNVEDLLTGGIYFHTSSMLFRNSFYNPGTGRSEVPAIFNDVRGDTIRLYVHAFQGGIRYLPQTMSVYDDHRGGIWTGLDWPGRRDLLNNLYTQLSQHGYLDDMGGPRAAEFLAEQLGAIAAYAPSSLRPISLYPDQVASAPRYRLTEVSRISSVLDLETQLSSLTADAKYEDALRLVFRFLSALAYDPNISRASRSRRLTSVEIDWHCANIGGLIAVRDGILPPAPDAQAAAEGPVVILVSGMADDNDGMWDQTRDMIALWQGRRRVVVMSTELLRTVEGIQDRVGPEVELLLNTDQGLVEKTAWLIWHMARLKPSQILVNPARNDVVIAAGLRREHAPRIHLLGTYSTGYLPSVHSYAVDGYVLRRAYDLAWFKEHAPQRELILLPRFLHDAAEPAPVAPDAPLVTATAALQEAAFEGHYDYGLPLIVPSLLRAGALRHVHVGALSQEMLHRIRKELIRQEFPPAAFVHLAGTDNMAGDLAGAGVTVFLHAFPWPEMSPLLAALGAGLPVIAHRSYLHPALSLGDICPPGTPEWSDPAHLETIVRSIGPDWIAAQSEAVRRHMAQRLSGKALSDMLADRFMAPVEPDALPDLPVPDRPQDLRRVMSEMMELTLFKV